MTRSSPRVLAAICGLGVLCAPLRGRAQEPRRLVQPDSVPIELATALASAGGIAGEPQILVGSIPEWIASRLYVPPGARVLGSAFLGTTVIGVLSMAPASDTVMAEFKRELLQRGWKMPPAMPSYAGGGFRPATTPPPDAPIRRVTLCGDQQMINASAARSHGTATIVTLRVTGVAGIGVCRPPQMPVSMVRSPFPTLINPFGAADGRMNGDCSTSMMGSMGTGTTLRTQMTADELLDHYGKQLQDSGWTSFGDKGSIVGRSWTRTDSSGAPVEVSITVTTSTHDAGCRDLSLQVRTLRKP